nr:MAG TPA: hypothetical protein [Caudoviricetes sp.]
MCVHTNCKYHNYVLYSIQRAKSRISRDNLYLFDSFILWGKDGD